MTRFDIRWLRRHPLRWLRIMWFPWMVSIVLIALAVVVREPVFFVTTAAGAWPIILAVVGGAVGISTVAPLERRVQATVASALFAMSVLRVATYVDTYLTAPDLSANAQAVVMAFGLHWVLIALAAVYWPLIMQDAGQRMTLEAGQDDRAI